MLYGKEKKVLSEQKRPIGAENTFQVCYDGYCKRRRALSKSLRVSTTSENMRGKKLKGKDLITIGIFSAIYFVINFAFMLLGGIHPVLWMLMPGFIAVFAGIPFMLMVAKVQKLGAVFLMGLITALIYFVTGQFTLVILISMASTCILAEIVRAVTKYNSFKGNSIAYVIFSLGWLVLPFHLVV